MFEDSCVLWHTATSAWQVSIATIIITEYGIVRKDLKVQIEVSQSFAKNGVIES